MVGEEREEREGNMEGEGGSERNKGKMWELYSWIRAGSSASAQFCCHEMTQTSLSPTNITFISLSRDMSITGQLPLGSLLCLCRFQAD